MILNAQLICLCIFIMTFCFVKCLNTTQGEGVSVTHDYPSTTPGNKQAWNATHTDKLKRTLLANYDKFARPAQHFNTTTVTIDMTLRHVDLDEVKSLLTVHSWVKLLWQDQKLKWNASEYGGLTSLHLADHEVWQPDIVNYNNAAGSSIDHYGNTHCIVHDDGTVFWVPPSQFTAFCNLDLRFWPFDIQTCTLRFGSWTYDGNQVDLQVEEGDTDIQLLVENTEWQLVDISKARNVVFYKCCDEPYIDVTYNLTLKRNSPTYKAIVITPVSVIILMTLISFWLPPQAGEKILLNGCTTIIICLFLVYFSQKLPALATNTPLIVLFYSSSLYLVCFSMIVSVIVIHISRNQHKSHLPWFIKGPLTGKFGKIIGLGDLSTQASLTHRVNAEELRDHHSIIFDEQVNSDEHQMITSSPKHVSQQDWILFALAIDRLCFLFYSFLFAILAIVYSV